MSATMQASDKPKLRQILAAYRGAFVAAAVFSVFINLLLLTIPLYLINVFSHVFGSRSLETLGMLTLVAGGALLLQAALELVRGRLLVRVSTEVEDRLGHEVFGATLLGAAGTNLHSAQPLRDVNELRNILGTGDIFRLVDITVIPLFVAVIYLFHPTLALIALGGALVLFALAVLNEWVTRKPLGQANQLAMSSINRAEDFVRNADVIRAMGMLPSVTKTWQSENEKKFSSLEAGSNWGNRLRVTARLVRMLLQMGLLGVGTYLYLQQEILPGTIIAASILMARALAPVESAIGTWKSVVSARAAYHRLAALLTTAASSNEQTALPVPLGRVNAERVMIAVRDSGSLLLKQITFELAPGELLGVIGPSGAGKSTLAKALVGVLRPTAGAVRLDGASLIHWDPDALGQHLGYLPQDVQLFAGTIAENIGRMNPSADPEAVVDAAQRVGVHDMILRLPSGYDTRIGEGGVALSSGQTQHIGLARAYFGNPTLVVLDEPNANLDADSEMALHRLLKEAKGGGTTQIVISHRPSVLQAADKMLLLREGAIDMFGPAQEVLARVTQKPKVEKMAASKDKPDGTLTSIRK